MAANIRMDNSGSEPLRVPGFNSVPYDYRLPLEERFTHAISEWEQVPMITARELTMLRAINIMTDNPEWFLKVSDYDMLATWKTEISATLPLLSDQAWDWCVAELKDKADEFVTTQFVQVLDAGSVVCKSDHLVSQEGMEALKSALGVVYEEQKPSSSHSTDTNTQILDVVDPRMFPLVFGVTPVFSDGGRTSSHPVEANSDARRASEVEDPRAGPPDLSRVHIPYKMDYRDCRRIFSTAPEVYQWSARFQSLPCDISWAENDNVKITSYINNLHPRRKTAYTGIEGLISAASSCWNKCLVKGRSRWDRNPDNGSFTMKQCGRIPLRITTFGAQWFNCLPRWAEGFMVRDDLCDCLQAQSRLDSIPETAEGQEKVKQWAAKRTIRNRQWCAGAVNAPKPTSDSWDLAREYLHMPAPCSECAVPLADRWEAQVRHLLDLKAREQRYFEHPQPGVAFSYEEWKEGHNIDKAVVKLISQRHYMDASMEPPCDGPVHRRYSVDLRQFESLQIIVKVGGIELTPAKPRYSAADWQTDSMLNEHIVATAIYSFDTCNVSPCQAEFRHQAMMSPTFYRYLEGHRGVTCKRDDPSAFCNDPRSYNEEVHAIAEIFGLVDEDLRYRHNARDWQLERCTAPFQSLGTVNVPRGRLITFPRTLDYRVGDLELIDPTRSGHHRWVSLFLVDPHYRICSTRNVPAQQHTWWAESVRPILTATKLPVEVVDIVLSHCEDWPMSMAQAQLYKQDIATEVEWAHLARVVQQSRTNFASKPGRRTHD